ncbi:MAG TPA: tetratricopeptide repeat protein, partial [Thermoguttaceae bacterium]
YVEAHSNLGIVLAGHGQADEAMAHLQKSLELKPDDAEVHNKLGEVLVSMGRVQDAISHFERALQLLPDDANIKKNLSNARAGHAYDEPAPPTRQPNP